MAWVDLDYCLAYIQRKKGKSLTVMQYLQRLR
jgi:hypothetical protein